MHRILCAVNNTLNEILVYFVCKPFSCVMIKVKQFLVPSCVIIREMNKASEAVCSHSDFSSSLYIMSFCSGHAASASGMYYFTLDLELP